MMENQDTQLETKDRISKESLLTVEEDDFDKFPIKNKPISYFDLVSTLINQVLPTGVFAFPYAISSGGVILGTVLLFIASMLSYIAVEFMIETISLVNADLNYKNCEFEDHPDDVQICKSPYYIRRKLEISRLTKKVLGFKLGIVAIVCLAIYILGSILFYTVVASRLITEDISYIFYGNVKDIYTKWPINPYWLFVLIFAIGATLFSFKNIEDSRTLQIFSAGARLFTIILIFGSCLYTAFAYSNSYRRNVKLADFSKIHIVFGNVVFLNIFHHSISGIYYPFRPQKNIQPITFLSIFCGVSFLLLEAFLCIIAFGGYTNDCGAGEYPCQIEDLISETLLVLPVVGQIINLYPFINISTIPVIVITLRNNLYYMIYNRMPQSTKIDRSRIIFTFSITIPMYILALFLKDQVETILNITGGITGVFVIFLIPATLLFYARRKFKSIKNFHQSNFKSDIWIYILYFFATVLIVIQIYMQIESLVS